MFRITGNKGFHITFPNGYTVSVQFGPGNYCENYGVRDFNEPLGKALWECEEAEAAVWSPDGSLLHLEGDTDAVQPRRSPEQVLALLNWAASQK